MKAERQQKERISRVIQPFKGGGGYIVDNRVLAANQQKTIQSMRDFTNFTIQRTIYDDDFGTIVWTKEFDEKHFAFTEQEAIDKCLARLKVAAYKNSGAKPSSNSVIIYDENLLWHLKEYILKHDIKNDYIEFKASIVIEVSPSNISYLYGSRVMVYVDEKGLICHLESITYSDSESIPLKGKSVSL